MLGQALVRSRPLRRVSSFILKLALSAGLIALVIDRTDVEQVLEVGRGINLSAAGAALGLIFLQIPVLSSRWRLVAQRLGSDIGILDALRLTWVGLFFNNFLPGAIGGDLVRAWLLRHFTIGLSESLASVFVDRVSAFIVILILIATFLPYLAGQDLPSALVVSLTLALVISGILFAAIALAITFWPKRAPAYLRALSSTVDVVRIGVRASNSLLIVLRLLFSALVVHGITISAVFMIARGIGANIAFVDIMIVVPIVMLILTIPISLAGWGVREGAMVLLLGVSGVSGAEAAVISVGWGLALLISSIPGDYFFLVLRR